MSEGSGASPEEVKPQDDDLELAHSKTQDTKPSDIFIKKSPQELAVQIRSVVSTTAPFSRFSEGTKLNSRYEQMRDQTKDLMESRVDDTQLEAELRKLYLEGRETGIYTPLQSPGSSEFVQAVKEDLMGRGYTAEEAESEAIDQLSREGYLANLRYKRRDTEQEFQKTLNKFIDAQNLPAEQEKQRIEEMQRRVTRLNDPEAPKKLAIDFPGGNFLYHGTSTEQAIGILSGGELMSAKGLIDREEELHKAEGRDKKTVRRNTGYEGISWSFNVINALPGDRYHLVGFLEAPQDALQGKRQLAIPSRPAPNELILIDEPINSKRYYDTKTQQELYQYISIGRGNSVLSNLIDLSIYKETGKDSILSGHPLLLEFVSKPVSDSELEKLLRSKFVLEENGAIRIAPDLIQQTGDDIPIAAIWLQALIDIGKLTSIEGFESITTVRQAIEKMDPVLIKNLFPLLRQQRNYLDQIVKGDEDHVQTISTPTSEMFFVVPEKDLDRWFEILARCDQPPKGILVYNHNLVRLENFASEHTGDNDALTLQIRQAIPPSSGYIDYEKILGESITPDKLTGHRHHVLSEQFLSNRHSLVLDQEGNITVRQ